jgi:hypothetical protein
LKQLSREFTGGIYIQERRRRREKYKASKPKKAFFYSFLMKRKNIGRGLPC